MLGTAIGPKGLVSDEDVLRLFEMVRLLGFVMLVGLVLRKG
jgi:hypothetical protein